MEQDAATAEAMRARRALIRQRYVEMVGECAAAGWPIGDLMALGIYRAANPEVELDAREKRRVRRRQAAQKRKDERQTRMALWRSSVYGVALREADRRQKWVETADAKPEARPKPKRRRKGAAALNQIAARMPGKLPRLTRKYAWQTGDANGASQHEQ